MERLHSLYTMKYCLILKLLSLEDLKSWADSQLNKGEDDSYIIDVSMAKNVNEVVTAINEIAKNDVKASRIGANNTIVVLRNKIKTGHLT